MAARHLVGLFVAAGALVLGGGCVRTGTVRYRFAVPEQRGSVNDVKVTPGRHDGYDVLGRCQRFAMFKHIVVIRGTGSRRIVGPTGAAIEGGWSDDMVALRARVETALGPVASLVWYSPGGCHQDGFTLVVHVPTYGQFDAAIAGVGAVLRDEGLGDDVEVSLASLDRDAPQTVDRLMRMPLARRPFFPYEASLAAGVSRRDEAWDPMFALHLGLIWGREAQHPSRAGWFWGAGVDGRFNPDAGDARWSAGPSLRAGRAFGALEPDRPGPGANRGTYVYGQVGAEWSARGALVVSSLGLTTLALGESILRRHNSTGNNATLLLLPLALLNHVQLDWALATSGDNRSQVALLLGFSL